MRRDQFVQISVALTNLASRQIILTLALASLAGLAGLASIARSPPGQHPRPGAAGRGLEGRRELRHAPVRGSREVLRWMELKSRTTFLASHDFGSQTLEGSLSAASKPNFVNNYSLESVKSFPTSSCLRNLVSMQLITILLKSGTQNRDLPKR